MTLAPPRGTYVPAQTWRAHDKAGTTYEPPPAADEIWRAFVNRQHPIQRKTPQWVPLPAADNVELEMPPNSRYRCLVTPLEVITDTNDFSTKLKAWVLTRYLRCSSDGWQSWTEYMERVRVAPDGTREVIQSAEAVLRERPPPGEPAEPAQHDILVLVKPDEENRAASPGPPKIMPGVVVDDD